MNLVLKVQAVVPGSGAISANMPLPTKGSEILRDSLHIRSKHRRLECFGKISENPMNVAIFSDMDISDK